MNLNVRVVRNDLAKFQKSFPKIIREAVHDAGREFYEITRANFGVSGIARPHAWPALSKRYIRRLKEKSLGTPLIPTLLRNGTLRASIRIGQVMGYTILIWTDCEYAATHQWGDRDRNIPARPYFPVFGGKGDSPARLTPYAESRIQRVISMRFEKAAGG